MGGSGAVMFALRHPERIAWGIGWVGVHVPEQTPQFSGSYAQVYGPKEWNVKFENGTPVWDYYNDVWFLRQHPALEIGFVSWSNGKNDGAIGWAQAVAFSRAMQETRRPHLFVWNQNGHGARAVLPGGWGEQRNNPLDIRLDQSLPAFTRCSLDGHPGNGDPSDGDPSGGINCYLLWGTKDIVDETNRYELTVFLATNAPQAFCTVDVTPRRLQQLRPQRGERFHWENTALAGGRRVQMGEVVADEHGLVTLPAVVVETGKNRLGLWR